MKPRTKGVIAALASAFFLGMAPVFGVRAMMLGMPPLAVVAIRTLLAALLLLLTDPLRRFSHRLISLVESVSGLVFVSIGVLGILFAGGFLDSRLLPVGEFGSIFSAGVIPVIYVFVGLKVGAEFTSMLANLAETERS